MKKFIRRFFSPFVLRMLSTVGMLENIESLHAKMDFQNRDMFELREKLSYLSDRREAQVRAWVEKGSKFLTFPLQLVWDIRIGYLFFPAFDSTIGPWIDLNGSWDEPLCEYLIENLKPGMNFLNVGSNVGYFPILASSLLLKSDSIWALEPHPRIHELAKVNSSLHCANNVTHLNYAASNKNHRLTLHESATNGGDHRLWADAQPNPSGNSYVVSGIRLDEFMSGKRIDFILLDTQGWDHFALIGSLGILISQHPTVVCEFTPSWLRLLGLDPQECISEYIGWGYKVSTLENLKVDVTEIVTFMEHNNILEINLVLERDLESSKSH